ncbi:MAG: tetratricopeptide repeat protein [Alphaproteobacteria bacterium]|nr:tetratricopeptide repeat protein [Alphaproteobacteria bacterium]
MRKVIVLFSLLFVVLLTSPVAAQNLNKGMEAHNRGDFATALREFRPLAEQGVAYAQFNLGFMHTFGHGVPQDYAEAMKWYAKAAEQGFVHAQHNLGIMHNYDHGVPQNYVEAVKWYRMAAAQGHAEAQFSLGNMYQQGYGVPQDYAEAMILTKKMSSMVT